MKTFNYETAINQLGLNKSAKTNNIRIEAIPKWVQSGDFINLFLPYVKIIGDSREQDKWVAKACEYYGIAFEWAKKDLKAKTENLKEGDYSYRVVFGEIIYDYVGKVAYERKGSISEFYNNCTGYDKTNKTSDRERIEREFGRFESKRYQKVVLLLEFGEKLTDLIDLQFSYYSKGGVKTIKSTHNVLYSTIMSWKQPNNKDFDIIQSNSHKTLFWLFLQDCYYYFRNEIKKECLKKNLIIGETNGN